MALINIIQLAAGIAALVLLVLGWQRNNKRMLAAATLLVLAAWPGLEFVQGFGAGLKEQAPGTNVYAPG